VTDPTPPAELGRLLRQWQEMGLGPLFLEGMDRVEVMARAARASGGAASQRGDGRSVAAEARSPGGKVQGSAPPPLRAGAQTAAPAALPVLAPEYEQLRAAALACTRCRLHEGRTQAVFSDGNPHARLMVVGEAPGAQEDKTGLPFVGPAGKLLDLMLASVGFSRRDNAYICNVIKCRPPGNRNPERDEIEACSGFLKGQIALVRPEAILAVGTFSGQFLTGTQQALGKLRGQVYSYEGVPVVVTYHPAALLRSPGWTQATWDDLQLLRQVLDG